MTDIQHDLTSRTDEIMTGKKCAVYGTLRTGEGNNVLLSGLEGTADTISGFLMRSYGNFPFIVYTGKPDDVIQVELFDVDSDQRSRSLDCLEGCWGGYTGFYDRIKVQTDSGEQVYLYVFHEDDPRYQLIEDGDWVKFCNPL